jgi:prepilin signal peptidase PulO-like enzyme (type II secretory pathway)
MLEFATWLQATSFSVTIQSVGWVVPFLQSVHILGIGVVFVSVLMVALRVLGRVRLEQSLAEVWARFAPFLWWGLAVMALTGLLLTISEPVREFMTLSFRLKLLLLVVGVLSAAQFGRRVRRVAAAGANQVPPGLRLAAIATVVLWLAIIFLGRAIAYDDVIWGSWSPAVLAGADVS